MTEMSMADRWKNKTTLVEHLARQLVLGRLGLFLGAGVSIDFDLPSWKSLVRRMAMALGEAIPDDNFNPISKAGALKARYFRDDEKRFCESVKLALYQDVELDFAKISGNRLLSAIGSLVMASQRGSASKIITLNYDNLLELYLEFHGFTTATIHDGCHWARNEDVIVYHPHGFLPLGHSNNSARIILDTTDFHGIMRSEEWKPIIETSLRQRTFLYLGFSGEDLHIESHWTGLSNFHAIRNDRTLYHGVRFSTKGTGDDISVNSEKWGIHTHEISDYSELPDFLFQICQKAREIRATSYQ